MKHTTTTLLTLLLMVGSASAFVCYDSAVSTDNEVVWEKTDLTFNYPSGDTTISSPIEFQVTSSDCHQQGTVHLETILNITQGGITVYSNGTYFNSDSPDATNITTNYTLTLPDGTYNMTYVILYGVANLGSPPTYGEYFRYTLPTTPYILTVSATSNTGADTSGACLSPYGYYDSITAGAAEDYILHDFTTIKEYCLDANCSNIFSENVEVWQYTDYKIIANATNYKNYNLYISGHTYNYNHTKETPTPDKTITYTSIANFTRQNQAYWIDINDELSTDAYNLTEPTPLVMHILCDTNSPDTINLKTLNKTNFLLTTKEQPLLHIEAAAYIDRKIQTYQDTENISFYLPETTDITFTNGTQRWIIDYVLESYITGWDGSYLKIIRNSNGTLVTVWQQKWVGLKVDDVDLLNNTYYQYTLYLPNSDDTRIIKWDQITNNETRTLIVQTPTVTDFPKYIDELEFYITSSYTTSELGVIYNVADAGIQNVTVKVYNYTSAGGFQVMDTTVATSKTGTITISVPDNNQTYYITADIYTTKYGETKISELVKLAITESRYPFYDSFNIPADVFGISRDRIYTGAAMFIITGFAFMFSGLEVATGGLILVAVVGVMTYIGWLREMTWTLWLFLAAMAILWKLVEGRRSE